MKISELRALLDRTSSEDMKRILVEVYRALPKKTREDLAIDELLKNPAAARAGAKQAKALAYSVDIDDLEPELEGFLSDAYAQNYFAPNRFVPKSERPKWRFKVKRFFKEINAAVVETGSIERASDLLEKLYQMLCYACDFVLFSAYDPFQSVGIAQTEFLDAVFGLKAEHLELGKFIDHGLHLVRDSRLNRYTLGSSLAQVLIDRLRTPESLELGLSGRRDCTASPMLRPAGNENTIALTDSTDWRSSAFSHMSSCLTTTERSTFSRSTTSTGTRRFPCSSCCNGCVRSSAKIFGNANMKELFRQVSNRVTACRARIAI